MNPRQIRIAVLALIVAAFLLRLGAIVALRSWRQPNAMEHRTIAMNIVSGDGFTFRDFGYYGPTSIQSPPYPYLLAGLFKLFGTDTPQAYFAAMLINAVIGAATVGLTYLLARTLGGSPPIAIGAAALCAVWPTQIYAVAHVQAVVFITACMTAMVVLFYRAVRTRSVGAWIAYSLIAALGTLTEPVLLMGTFCSGLMILAWPPLSLNVRIRFGAILLMATAVIIGPWALRNHAVHGKWIPIKSGVWVNVWKGANDYATGTDRLALSPEQSQRLEKELFALSDERMRDPEQDRLRQYDMLTPEQRTRLEHQPEAVRETFFKEWATSWIAAHPARYAQLCLLRLGKTLWIDWDNPKSHNAIYVASRAAILLLSAGGVVIAIRRRWSLLFPAILTGTCLLTYTLTITAARFSIPFEPLQLCLAAALIMALQPYLRRRPAVVEQARVLST